MFLNNISKFQDDCSSLAAVICRTMILIGRQKKLIFQDFEIQLTCFKILTDLLFDALSRYDKEKKIGGGQIFDPFIYSKIHQ